LLRAVDVSFGYGDTPVLRNVAFSIRSSSLVGVLGPNGSGKTTLLRLLAGVVTPTRGEVIFDDAPIRALPRRWLAQRIAVVPQDTHLTFDYRVIEVALMGRHPYLGPFELEGPEDVAAARRALDATGTLHLAGRHFDSLSGGERQRVVIASALAQFEEGTPRRGRAQRETTGRVLLLDEPTASLDLHYQIEVGMLLRRLHRERELTIVVTTHDLNFAAGVCEELILLREGEVVGVGPTESVLTSEAVRTLYGIDADVRFHDAAGHLTVTPLRTSARAPGDAAGAARDSGIG
jgi:iron complex transport system ATP-binding protein